MVTINTDIINPSNVPKMHINTLFGSDLYSGEIGESKVLKTYASFEEANISV